MKPELFLIYLLVTIYAVCYQLQVPVEPFLVDQLVGNNTNSQSSYAQLQSFFSFVQFVGSLFFGYLLDVTGVRVGFAINFIACAAQYGILANTTSINMLWASKVPALFMCGFLCAQAAVSQLTEQGSERVTALGRLTTSYTIGGVVGPWLGGYLGSDGDYFLGARLAMTGSLVAAALVFALPSKVNKSSSETKATSGSSDGLPWITRATTVIQLVGVLLLAKVMSGVANSMSSSAQPVILKDKLHFTEEDMGKFLSSQFAFGGFANGFLLGPLTALLGGGTGSGSLQRVVLKCVLIMSSAYFFLAVLYNSDGYSSSQIPYVATTMLLAVFQFSMATTITAETTARVSTDMTGTLMGIEHSLFAVARIIGPQFGVAMLQKAGLSGLAATCACVFASIGAVLFMFNGSDKVTDKVE